MFSISVDSYLDHWQSRASSCRGPLGAAGNTDEELHQGRKANTISLIDSGNVLKLINVFIGFESNCFLSLSFTYKLDVDDTNLKAKGCRSICGQQEEIGDLILENLTQVT